MATHLSDSDMAVAAAYASGSTYISPPLHQQRVHKARSVRTPMPDDEGDLPNIDDLQIAAGAAAGKKDPVWPVLRKALGEVHSSDEEDEEHNNKAAISAAQTDEDMQEAPSQDEADAAAGEEESSDEETSDSSSSSSDDESVAAAPAGRQAGPRGQEVDVSLQVDAGGRVRLQLGVGAPGSAEDEVEELRAELDRMERGGEDADDAHMEKGIVPPAVEPLDIEMLPDDVLLPVGRVSAIVGPTIVVQAPENGRAVSEGTPLCLGTGQPVGRVEDVFGPVMEPLYSLRYACGPQMPSEIAVGTAMCSIQRLTDYILPQELYAKGYDKAEDGEESNADEEEEVDEFEFSDDESEATWRRKQLAAEPGKRKLPQASPAHAMHHGDGRGRGRSQRGRSGGEARGRGRARAPGNFGNDRGGGRGRRGSGSGRGPSHVPSSRGGMTGMHEPARMAESGGAFTRQPPQAQQAPNGQHLHPASPGQYGTVPGQGWQSPQAQFVPNGQQSYQQQQHQSGGQTHPQNRQQLHHAQQQQQQQPATPHYHPGPASYHGMQGGQQMQAPPGRQPQQQPSWEHQGPTQQRDMQWRGPVQAGMDPSYGYTNMHLQSPGLQQQQWPPTQAQAEHGMHGHHQQHPGQQQQQQQQMQKQQYGQPMQYQHTPQPQQQQQQQQYAQQHSFAQSPSMAGPSTAATSAYLARLQGRPSKPGGGCL